MKKIVTTILIVLALDACSSQSEYEKTIIEYLETHKGVRTDLKIEFKSIEVSDITISDSISILQTEFEAIKAKKVESTQQSINRLKNKIDKQKRKNTPVSKALISEWAKNLESVKKELEKAKTWESKELNKYDSHNSSEILAKKVLASFSFFNPQLQTKQEQTALFILSADGTTCNNMIKQ